MPITQQRMIALVRAADSLASKLETLRGAVGKVMLAQDTESALANLAVVAPFCAPTTSDLETIISERVHFKHCEHRNNRSRARMRAARGNANANDQQYLELSPAEAQISLSELDKELDGELELSTITPANGT
jgi:hypothetical protein